MSSWRSDYNPQTSVWLNDNESGCLASADQKQDRLIAYSRERPIIFLHITDWFAIHFLNDIAPLQASRCRQARGIHSSNQYSGGIRGDPEVARNSGSEILHLDAP
jgi:hypothetical protein